MNKVYQRIDGSERWIWYMPDLAEQIPDLFAEAGEVLQFNARRGFDHELSVKLRFKRHVRVLRTQKVIGEGLVVHLASLRVLYVGFPIILENIPTTLMDQIDFRIKLRYQARAEHELVTLQKGEDMLRAIAELMTKNWYLI